MKNVLKLYPVILPNAMASATDMPGIHPIDHEVRVGNDKYQRLKSKLISLPLYMIGQMRRLMESQV